MTFYEDFTGSGISVHRIGSGHRLSLNNISVPCVTHELEDILMINKLAIRRCGRIGDMVMLEPLVRFLQSIIDSVVVVSSKEYSFIFSCPVVQTVPDGYYVIDLDSFAEMHPLSATEHRTDIFARSVGVFLNDPVPRITDNNEVRDDLLKWMDANGISRPFIVAVPRSVSLERTWKKSNELFERLRETYCVIDVDSEYWKTYDKMPPLSINHLYYLVKFADLVITPDTGVMHLAGAAGTPFIGLYTQQDKSASNPAVRCQYYRNYTIVESKDLNIDYILNKVMVALSTGIPGKQICSRIDTEVHIGNDAFKFRRGIPVWVENIHADRLLLTNDFYSADEPDIHSDNNLSVLWILNNTDFGGAELHSMSLIEYFQTLGFSNYVLSLSREAGSMASVLHSISDGIFYCDSNDSTFITSVISRVKPAIIIQTTTAGAEFRRLWKETPHVFIAHGHSKLPIFTDSNTGYIYTSNSLADFIGAPGPVVDNGIDCEFYSGGLNVRDRLGLEEGFTVLYSGRLSQEKNIQLLIEACAALDINLVIAGSGYCLDELKALVNKLGISNRVSFRGYVPSKGIRNLLSSVDLMVLPSNTESMPLCILEAMAAKCPIVATSVGDVPVVLNNGECGTLFEPGDLRGLCKSIEAVINDPVSTQLMVERAYNRVTTYYDARTMKMEYANIIGGMMGYPSIGVVVVDKGQGGIDKTLDSFVHQYPNISAIVLSNGDDKSIARYKSENIAVLYLSVDNYQLSDVLRFGVESLRCDIVTFVESGYEFTPGWIEALSNMDGNSVISSFKYKEKEYSTLDYEDVYIPLSCIAARREIVQNFITSANLSTSLELITFLQTVGDVEIGEVSTICHNDPMLTHRQKYIMTNEFEDEGDVPDSDIIDSLIEESEDVSDYPDNEGEDE